uniref:Uncharacterized protein n=1 Tax=Nelumbo nucifera TaxID=4432 RepID=A0A822XZF5_NELNU|nr:TPA_asm: hypothetical protein HUJ06_026577 [Nelumbo nucifera]
MIIIAPTYKNFFDRNHTSYQRLNWQASTHVSHDLHKIFNLGSMNS